jgi:hypothetical protein
MDGTGEHHLKWLRKTKNRMFSHTQIIDLKKCRNIVGCGSNIKGRMCMGGMEKGKET